jgi:SSS family solute:Na+ symporter/sodium/pantothenate symporter
MGALAIVAFSPRITLWGLIEFKMELLIQISPLFFLGTTWARFQARPALLGLLLGSGAAVFFTFAGIDSIAGLPSGIFAWTLNLLVAVSLSLWTEPRPVPVAAEAA